MSAPLLLLHGALGSADQFKPLLPLLGTRVVYTYNFIGHGGRAIKGDFSIADFAAELYAWLNAERLNEVDIFGYSMGGYVALKLAEMHPARVGAIMTLGTKFDWSPESAAQEVAMLDADKIATKVPKFVATLSDRHAPTDWREVTTKTASMLTALGEKPVLDAAALGKIKSPVFVSRGMQDDTVSAESCLSVANLLPNGKYISVPDSKHPFEQVDLALLSTIISVTIPYNHDH